MQNQEIVPIKSNANMCNYIFYLFIFVVQIGFIVAFAIPKYPDFPYGKQPDVKDENSFNFEEEILLYHSLLIDISLFGLLGYGFLISFFRFHRWMSLGITYFIFGISIQIYLLSHILWSKTFSNEWSFSHSITLIDLIASEKAAISALIALGAIVGKIDLFQALIFSLIEILCFALNEQILFYAIKIRYMGGAFYIHTYAAFFGVI